MRLLIDKGETMKNLELIKQANDNLTKLYPEKHFPITESDIEKVYSRNVLGIAADAKTVKGQGKGYLTGIMYLAPSKLAGVNLCPAASQGCIAACLFSAGRGRFYVITRARVIKTLAYLLDKPRFHAIIKKSIKSLVVKAKNKGLIPVVRLNGTSDLLWERESDIMQSFPNVQFYDYTKLEGRFNFPLPANYHLTFSLSESNQNDAVKVLQRGGVVAAVFAGDLPAKHLGFPVSNADSTDLRFLDQPGSIAGLKAKGKAKHDQTGFVIRLQQANAKLAA